ncbi:PEP-CTERM sorting domain-containing protein [Mariniblastus sp.]|nr:PEP-CTERM sorting domain-containing protein [Mariniblastus sp.]
MINKLIFSLAFAILLCFTSQSKADWVMDFGPGLSSAVSSFSMTPGANFTGTLDINHSTGHTWTTTGVAGDPDKKVNIRYEFPSLIPKIGPFSPEEVVSFAVPLASNSSEGVFSIVGTAERASGASYTFTNDSGGTPNDPNGDFEWITSITMTDLQADDIVALNFEITYDFGSGPGLDQTFTFGGPGGLIAAPEPTSAAMIGCALVGLIARRRRKA